MARTGGLFYSVGEGLFDNIKKEKWTGLESLLLKLLRNKYKNILENIKKGIFDEPIKEKIKTMVNDFNNEFILKA